MAFLEYMLLALLGSAGATPAGPARTFTAGAITQPDGGTDGQGDINAGMDLIGQDTGGCKTGARPTGGKGEYNHGHMSHTRTARHHRRGHTHGKTTTEAASSASKVSSSTGNKGGVKPNMNRQPPPKRPRAAPSNSNKNSK